MVTVIIIFSILVVVGLGVFVREIKRAEVVSSKKSFIYGDYDPKNDSTLKKKTKYITI